MKKVLSTVVIIILLTMCETALAKASNPTGYSIPTSFTNRSYPGTLIWPLGKDNRNVTSWVGGRTAPTAGASTNHHGTDIWAPENTPIMAADGGIAYKKANYGSLGNAVIIDHNNGYYTLYGHLNSFADCLINNSTATVTAGECIGYVGKTGTATGFHLHFEIAYNWWGKGLVSEYSYTWAGYNGGHAWGNYGWEILDGSPNSQSYNYINGPSSNLPQIPTISSDATAPISLSNGSSFWLKGTISCKYPMTEVRARVYNCTTGSKIFDIPVTPNSTSYTLGTTGEKINDSLRFGDSRLNNSWCRYELIVTYNKNGTSYTKRIFDRYFTVGSAATITLQQPGVFRFVCDDETRSGPAEANGLVRSCSEGTIVFATGYELNNSRNMWLKLTDGSYVWSGDVNRVTFEETPISETYSFSEDGNSKVYPYVESPNYAAYEEGDSVAVVAQITNTRDEVWYKLSDDSWVSSDTGINDPSYILVSGITLDQTKLNLDPGDTFALAATVSPDNATKKTVNWTTSDNSVAMVNESGLVTAVAPGTATITASATDKSGQFAVCNITVNPIDYTFEFRDVVYPKTFRINTTNGWFLQGGTLVSDAGLTSIQSIITRDSDGVILAKYTKDGLSGNTFAIKSIDSNVYFSNIQTAGKYTWTLIGKDSNNRTLTLEMPFTAVSSGSTVTDTAGTAYPMFVPVSEIVVSRQIYFQENANHIGAYAGYRVEVLPSNATNKELTFSIGDELVVSFDDLYQITDPTSAVYGEYYFILRNVGIGSTTLTVASTDGSNVDATLDFEVVSNITSADVKLQRYIDGELEDIGSFAVEHHRDFYVSSNWYWTFAPGSYEWMFRLDENSGLRLEEGEAGKMNNSGRLTAEQTGTYNVYIDFYENGQLVPDGCRIIQVEVIPWLISWININQDEVNLPVGSSIALEASMSPTIPTNPNIVWSSSDSGVATVDEAGVVTAIAPGTATITATAADGGGADDYCNITVLPGQIQITKQPESVTASQGDAVFFTIECEETDLSYQWQWTKNGTKWYDSGNSTAKTANLRYVIGANDDGMQFRCRITDGNGNSVTSDAAAITIAEPAVVITKHPDSVTSAQGDVAYFTVAADGTNLTYQWQWSKNGTTWNNSGNSTAKQATLRYVIGANDNGMQFRCKVSDGEGNSANSNAATITFAIGPKITTHPQSVTATQGDVVYFTVAGEGTGLTYQWQWSKNGTNWYDSGNSTAKTANLRYVIGASDNGMKFRCKVTDADGGATTSNAATITFGTGPKITTQPQSVTAVQGDVTYFTVAAEGTSLTYQWQWSKNGTNWYDSGNSTAKTANLRYVIGASDNGMKFRCKVTDADGGATTSNAATITFGTGPKITTQPQSVTAAQGDVTYFTVAAEGTGLTYQWQWSKNGTNWYDSGNSTAKTANLRYVIGASDNGMKFRCKVTDADGGATTSNVATITFGTGPKITTQPQSVIAAQGDVTYFTVAAEGTGLTYQWQWSKNGTSWNNSGNSTAKKETLRYVVGASDDGIMFRCKVTDESGNSSISNAASITFTRALTGTRQLFFMRNMDVQTETNAPDETVNQMDDTEKKGIVSESIEASSSEQMNMIPTDEETKEDQKETEGTVKGQQDDGAEKENVPETGEATASEQADEIASNEGTKQEDNETMEHSDEDQQVESEKATIPESDETASSEQTEETTRPLTVTIRTDKTSFSLDSTKPDEAGDLIIRSTIEGEAETYVWEKGTDVEENGVIMRKWERVQSEGSNPGVFKISLAKLSGTMYYRLTVNGVVSNEIKITVAWYEPETVVPNAEEISSDVGETADGESEGIQQDASETHTNDEAVSPTNETKKEETVDVQQNDPEENVTDETTSNTKNANEEEAAATQQDENEQSQEQK